MFATIIITLSESTPKELSSKEKEDVRDQLIMGLCPVDQKKLWVKFGNPTYSTEYRFNKLANKITRHEALIADNLHEMAPLQPLFDSKERRDQLRSVLKAYAAYDETLGYCQGMNFIAGCLLEHLLVSWLPCLAQILDLIVSGISSTHQAMSYMKVLKI
ncbi:hypothetical protein CLU79DRAFT_768229 [Phycomyces nitens]|nr:hypothetical protein CLU79DRAFT_768229 [Phycomyces nitens]